MIKSDYGHLYLPFYEQKLKNGLKVILIPSQKEEESALLYISQGGYLHDEKIEESKIPFGTAYYMANMVMNPSFKEKLLLKGAIGECRSDLSYTSFQVTSRGDVFPALSLLMDRLYEADFKEDELESIKDVLSEKKTRESICHKGVLENLYSSSPIRRGIVPDREESIPIHVTALRKFTSRYYTPSRVTLIIMGNHLPGDCIDKITKLRMPKASHTKNKELKFDEDYKNPKIEYSCGKDPKGDTLSFGVKLPPREELFNKFGQLTFMSYEVLLDVCFRKNPLFKKEIMELESDLVGSELRQGGEDTALILTFRTKVPLRLLSFLTDYFGRLDRIADRKVYSDVLSSYFASSVSKMRNPHECVNLFASAYANNMPYTSLLASTSKMNIKSFRSFLKELSIATRSAYFLEKEENA